MPSGTRFGRVLPDQTQPDHLIHPFSVPDFPSPSTSPVVVFDKSHLVNTFSDRVTSDERTMSVGTEVSILKLLTVL